MSDAPSMFSAAYPKLQWAWDATSLKALQTCPRYYQYTILEGWRGSTIDLEFGGLFASSLEFYKKARLGGATRDQAQLVALQYAMEQSGTYEAKNAEPEDTDVYEGFWAPWGGSYRDQWRCTGTEPYVNEKGNKAKCPLSHKGVWQEDFAPSICGVCGSPVEEVSNWVPINPAKDRYALIRAVVWYCEEQPEDMSQGLAPINLPNGTPAVELPFRIPLPWKTPDGWVPRADGHGYDVVSEPYMLVGYLDSIVRFGTELFIADDKTTKKLLNKGFWDGFSPHVQVDTYDLAGSILFPDLPIKGVIIEGTQLLVGGARFGKHVIYHNEAQREEYFQELEGIIRMAEKYAAANHWPMNRASCFMCGFKKICSKSPQVREQYLAADFKKQHWNPLEER